MMPMPGAPPMPGMAMPGAMPAPGGEGGDAAFAQGLLAGAGLRELSQVLGLSRKRNGNSGAEPSSASMMAGNIGDLDKIMLLAKAQSAMKAPAPSPMGVPPMPGVPMGPAPMPLPPPAPGPMPGAMPPPGAGMRPPMPMPGPGGMPMPGGVMPGPGMAPAPAPAQPAGGALAQMLLRQMLGSAAGPV